MIGVFQEPGEHFHHAGEQSALVGAQGGPVLHVWVRGRYLGARRHDPQRDLAIEYALAVGVPTVVELALVAVRPGLWHVVRRMHRAQCEVAEERLVRRHLLGIGDEGSGPFDKVGSQVVALLRRGRRFCLVVVVHQLRVVLVGVTAQESVEALETAPQRPTVVGAGGGIGLFRRQVPFAQAVGAVAHLAQDLREHAIGERHVAIGAGKTRGAVGQAPHVVGVVVAPGQDARPRGRAQRGGVHVVVQQPIGGQRIDMRRTDRTAIAPQVAVAGVIEHDEQHVGRAGRCTHRFGPGGRGFIGGATDHPRESGAGLVFLERHGILLARAQPAGTALQHPASVGCGGLAHKTDNYRHGIGISTGQRWAVDLLVATTQWHACRHRQPAPHCSYALVSCHAAPRADVGPAQ
ncbi:hypothetical protein D3C71_1260390 [compost metagenome]